MIVSGEQWSDSVIDTHVTSLPQTTHPNCHPALIGVPVSNSRLPILNTAQCTCPSQRNLMLNSRKAIWSLNLSFISTILSILPSRGKYIHVIVQPNFTFSLYFAKGNSVYIKQLHICPVPVTGNGRSTFYKELSPVSCDNLGEGGWWGRWEKGSGGRGICIPVADSC